MSKPELNILSSLTINNFRVFATETKFTFAPITILTGTNSSGKSSLTKAITLLARSYQISGLRKLNIFESDLKIGGFNSIRNNKSSSDLISFVIKLEPSNLEIKLYFSEQKLSAFQIYENGKLFLADLLDRFAECEVTPYFHLPQTFLNKEKFRSLFHTKSYSEFDVIFERITERFRRHPFTPFFQDLPNSRGDVFYECFRDRIQGISEIGVSQSINYDEGIETFMPNKYLFDIMPEIVTEFGLEGVEVYDLLEPSELMIFGLPMDLPFSDIIKTFFNQFVLIPSIRSKHEVLITVANSPILFDQIQKYHGDRGLKDRVNILLEKWLIEEFKLMDVPEDEDMSRSLFQIVPVEDLGYLIQLCIDDEWTNLSSLGYGIGQLLPVVLSVILNEHSMTYIIEEPESNLHPALQSKLADFFFSFLEVGDPTRNKQIRIEYELNGWIQDLTVERNNRFIIETHSEYLIRKLQYLTASSSSLKSKDTLIYYFYPPNKIPAKDDQVKKILINENGSLSDDFGEGFIDEASSWKFELLKINNAQNN